MTRPLAVITGPSRGIGRATALALAHRGLDLALLGRQSATLARCRTEVASLGITAEIFDCDVSNAATVTRAADAVMTSLGVPHVVINNAGIVRRGTLIEDTHATDWADVIATNLSGPFLVTRAFLARMKQSRRGRFVHVGSISSTLGCPSNASYAASKWGLAGFAQSLADELRGTGVLSMSILPGSVDTTMLEGSGFPPAMTPDDVAQAIAYLALDAPAAMHGTSLEMFG